MSKLSPLISVIVPAHNEEAEIEICLNSLLKQDLNKKYYEIILVDNASTDGTAEIIKKYPFKYVYESKKSVVIARQTGVNASRGKIIVSADADTKYPKDWLTQIKISFDKEPDLTGLVGWIRYRGVHPPFRDISTLGQKINLAIYKGGGKFPIVFAANFAFKRSALKKIGGYPKHLPELGDQQYLLRKFQKIGKVIVNPKVRCFTSNRQLQKPGKNIFVYNGWHRLIGYPLNFLFDKEIIGPGPEIRKPTRPQKSRS